MKEGGFTLVELIITIAIVSLIAIAVFIATNPAKRIGETQDSRRWSDLVSIARAIELYTADYGDVPSDFSTSTVGVNDKVVLCSSGSTLTCDGQTKGCLVVDDTDFLGVYLNNIPVDPSKSADTDTGYYLTRKSSGLISFGACSDYQSDGMELVSKVYLPTYSITCGDGLTQGDEVCDDGNLVTEYCGDGTKNPADTCSADCSTVHDAEGCDYDSWVGGCWDMFGTEITEMSPSSGTYCDIACTSRSFVCWPES